jgi:hypothetical protein
MELFLTTGYALMTRTEADLFHFKVFIRTVITSRLIMLLFHDNYIRIVKIILIEVVQGGSNMTGTICV